MIYLLYILDSEGNYDITRCRDEIHYLDILVDVESRARLVPTDIRWHGSETVPPMRILSISTLNDEVGQNIHDVIADCAIWLRKN